MRQKLLLKLGIAAVAVAVFCLLFVRSLRQTTAEPYVLNQTAMTGWRLALAQSDERNVAVLSLRPPVDSVRELFQPENIQGMTDRVLQAVERLQQDGPSADLTLRASTCWAGIQVKS